MKQVIKSVLLTILMSIAGAKLYAYDFEKDGFYYNLDSYDMTAIVTYGENLYKGNVIIPNAVSYNGRTMNIKAVGESAFKDCVDLSSIQFGSSIQYIDEEAFRNCKKIKKLTIPSNIKRINRYAFYGCTNLEELIIEDGGSELNCGNNGYERPSFVFDCRLKYLYIGRNVGYSSWSEYYDLDNSNLSTIVIGKGKTFIAGFGGAKITKITIPSNVNFITKGAFKNCKNLKSVYFEDSNVELVWQEAYDKVIGSSWESVSPFYDCPIREAYIGRNISPWKGNLRFSGGEGPFDWTPVEKITISDFVTTLCGIYYCNYVKEIVIPSSVQSICGFKGSNSLTTIKCMNSTPPTLKKSYYTLADNSTYLNGIVYVPTGSVEKYKKDENWGKFFNIQEFDPSNISHIQSKTIHIKCEGGLLTIQGVEDGTDIAVYKVSGQMVFSTKANGNQTSVATNFKKGEVAIIKIGEKSVKVVM